MSIFKWPVVALTILLFLLRPAFAQPDSTASVTPHPALWPYTRSLNFSHDGTLLVAGMTWGQWLEDAERYVPHSSELRAWDVAGGHLKWKVPGLSNEGTEVIASPDGKKVVERGQTSKFKDGSVRYVRAHLVIRDAASGAVLHAPELEEGERIMTANFSPDSKFLVTGSYVPQSTPASCIKVWEVETGKLMARHGGIHGYSHQVRFSADGKSLLAIRAEVQSAKVEQWSFPEMELQHSREISEVVVWACVISRDEKLFTGGGLQADGTATGAIGLWNLETGEKEAQFRPNFEDFSYNGATFMPDDRTLVIEGIYPLPGQEDTALEFMTILWFVNGQTGELQRTLQAQGAREGLRYLAQLGPDGNSFLATNGDKVELRSLADGALLRTFK